MRVFICVKKLHSVQGPHAMAQLAQWLIRSCVAGVKAGLVHLCRVTGNTV